MANTQSAKKALRSDARKRVFNVRRNRAMKDSVKEVHELVRGGQLKEAQAKLPEAYKSIDKAARRGVIKKNTAARKKSRLVGVIKRAS